MTALRLLAATARAAGRWPVLRAALIAVATGVAPAVVVVAAARWATTYSVAAATMLGLAFAVTGVRDAVVRSVGAWTGSAVNLRLRSALVATGTGPQAERAFASAAWEDSRGTGIRREPKPGDAFAEALAWLSTVVSRAALLGLLAAVQPLMAVGTILIGYAWRHRNRLGVVAAIPAVAGLAVGGTGLGWYDALLAGQATIGLAWLELTGRPVRRRVLDSGLRLLAVHHTALAAAGIPAPRPGDPVVAADAIPSDGVTGVLSASPQRAVEQIVAAAQRMGTGEVAVLTSPTVTLPFDVAHNVWPAGLPADADQAAAGFTPLADLVAALPLGWRTPCSDEWEGGVELDDEQWAVVGAGRMLARLDAGAAMAVADVSGLPPKALADFVSALRVRGRPAVVVGVRPQDAWLFDRVRPDDRPREVQVR